MGAVIDGQAEVVRDLGLLVGDVDQAEDAYAEIAAYGATVAAGFVRSKSGRLARSLRPTATPGQATVTSTEVYAGPQNYGWKRRGIRAQRFMQQADREVEPRAVAVLEREADRAIDKRGF